MGGGICSLSAMAPRGPPRLTPAAGWQWGAGGTRKKWAGGVGVGSAALFPTTAGGVGAAFCMRSRRLKVAQRTVLPPLLPWATPRRGEGGAAERSDGAACGGSAVAHRGSQYTGQHTAPGKRGKALPCEVTPWLAWMRRHPCQPGRMKNGIISKAAGPVSRIQAMYRASPPTDTSDNMDHFNCEDKDQRAWVSPLWHSPGQKALSPKRFLMERKVRLHSL